MSAAYGEGARRFRWGLAAIAAGAAVVRLGVYFRYYRGTQFGFNSAPYYSQTAIALADGRWFVDSTGRPAAEHEPVTTLLLAPVSWIDTPEDWQRLVTVLTGVAAVVVIGLVGRRLGGDRVGLVARPGRPVPGAVAQRRPGDVGEPGRPRRRAVDAGGTGLAGAPHAGVGRGHGGGRRGGGAGGPSWAC